jgi:hypothetical protein
LVGVQGYYGIYGTGSGKIEHANERVYSEIRAVEVVAGARKLHGVEGRSGCEIIGIILAEGVRRKNQVIAGDGRDVADPVGCGEPQIIGAAAIPNSIGSVEESRFEAEAKGNKGEKQASGIHAITPLHREKSGMVTISTEHYPN